MQNFFRMTFQIIFHYLKEFSNIFLCFCNIFNNIFRDASIIICKKVLKCLPMLLIVKLLHLFDILYKRNFTSTNQKQVSGHIFLPGVLCEC